MASRGDPVADMLGVRTSEALLLMSTIKEGLSLDSLDRVVHAVAPTDNTFAHQIISRATLARRRKARATAGDHRESRLSPDEGTRLARLASVWAMALDVWGGEEAARRFMFGHHMLLDGRRPIDVVLESELGRPAVEGILGRLKYGIAV